MRNCLVLGGAKSVFEDAEHALSLGEFQGVVTCNDVTAAWNGDIDAAVTLHGENWALWLRKRKGLGYSAPKRVIAHAYLQKAQIKTDALITDYVHHLWPGQNDSGSSGLFAVKIALDLLNFDRVVACGIPMTCEGAHFFNPKPWNGAASHRRGWVQSKSYLGNVRSMSGWTAQLVGKPTTAWLEGESE